MGHAAWPRPFQGHFAVRRLGLAIRSTCTPSLKSLCSPTKRIWKATQNVGMGMVCGLRVTQGHRQCHHSIQRIQLPIDFNSYSESTLCRFRLIASYLSNVAYFCLPYLHLANSLKVIPFEFRGDVWRKKTQVSWDVVLMIIRLTVLVQYGRVIDGRADGQTDRRTYTWRQHIPC